MGDTLLLPAPVLAVPALGQCYYLPWTVTSLGGMLRGTAPTSLTSTCWVVSDHHEEPWLLPLFTFWPGLFPWTKSR